MRYSLAHEHVDGDVVQHVAVVIDDPVLAVGRVGVERDVCYYSKLRQLRLDCFDRALHEAIRVGALGAVEALLVLVDDREQGDCMVCRDRALRASSLSRRSILFRETPGIEGTSSVATNTVEDKDGVDEISARQSGFLDERAQGFAYAGCAAYGSRGTVRGTIHS